VCCILLILNIETLLFMPKFSFNPTTPRRLPNLQPAETFVNRDNACFYPAQKLGVSVCQVVHGREGCDVRVSMVNAQDVDGLALVGQGIARSALFKIQQVRKMTDQRGKSSRFSLLAALCNAPCQNPIRQCPGQHRCRGSVGYSPGSGTCPRDPWGHRSKRRRA
jgi:hypothetical protein